MAATRAIGILAPILMGMSPTSGQATQKVRNATFTMIQASTTAASWPLGLGYSMRLTISQATPSTPSSAHRLGSNSSTIEITVIAPIGMGSPMKSPLLVLTQAKRASRTTPATSTATAAATTATKRTASVNPPQITTMNAGAKPKQSEER